MNHALIKDLFEEFEKVAAMLRAEGCNTAVEVGFDSPNGSRVLRWDAAWSEPRISIAHGKDEQGEYLHACPVADVLAAAGVLDKFVGVVRAAKIDDAKVQAAIEQARAALRPVQDMPRVYSPMNSYAFFNQELRVYPQTKSLFVTGPEDKPDVEASRLTNAELAEVLRLCEQYRVNAGERLGIEAFTTLQQSMLRTLPPLAKEAKEARALGAVADMPASELCPECMQTITDDAPDTGKVGKSLCPRCAAQKRVDAAQAQAKTPPTESEREQAKRWARMYLDAAGCEQDADEGTIDAMLPLVREARASEAAWQEQASANAHGAERRRAFQEEAEHERDKTIAELDAARAILTSLGAYTDDSKPLAEVIAWMHADMAQRLKVATEARAPLTEIPPDVRATAAEPEPKATTPREIRFVFKHFTEPKSYPEFLYSVGRMCPALSVDDVYKVADTLWPNGDLSSLASYYAAVRTVFPDAKIFDADGAEVLPDRQ